jgi:plasmid stabilization system protein ParE
MSGFVLHPEAFQDLEEIWEFIAADNVPAADRALEEIYETICALIPYPKAGHKRPDLTSRPLRFQPVRDFVVVYAPDEKTAGSPCRTSWPAQSACYGRYLERERMRRRLAQPRW